MCAILTIVLSLEVVNWIHFKPVTFCLRNRKLCYFLSKATECRESDTHILQLFGYDLGESELIRDKSSLILIREKWPKYRKKKNKGLKYNKNSKEKYPQKRMEFDVLLFILYI